MVKKSRTFLRQLEHSDGLNLQIFLEFMYLLETVWSHLDGLNFKIFFNHGEEITYCLETVWNHLDGLNFQIFFNHGEEIAYLLETIWSIDGLNFIQDILRP